MIEDGRVACGVKGLKCKPGSDPDTPNPNRAEKDAANTPTPDEHHWGQPTNYESQPIDSFSPGHTFNYVQNRNSQAPIATEYEITKCTTGSVGITQATRRRTLGQVWRSQPASRNAESEPTEVRSQRINSYSPTRDMASLLVSEFRRFSVHSEVEFRCEGHWCESGLRFSFGLHRQATGLLRFQHTSESLARRQAYRACILASRSTGEHA